MKGLFTHNGLHDRAKNITQAWEYLVKPLLN